MQRSATRKSVQKNAAVLRNPHHHDKPSRVWSPYIATAKTVAFRAFHGVGALGACTSTMKKYLASAGIESLPEYSVQTSMALYLDQAAADVDIVSDLSWLSLLKSYFSSSSSPRNTVLPYSDNATRFLAWGFYLSCIHAYREPTVNDARMRCIQLGTESPTADSQFA